MEIILIQDVKGLGYKNDIVNVKPGYGRNYLIPQGLAVNATTSNVKRLEENLRQQARKIAAVKQQALELAASIGDTTLVMRMKAGESGKIFGSVTPIQISESLKAKGFDIDRKAIHITSDIKMLGEYTATLDLHKEVKHTIKLKVEEEA